MIYCRDVVLDCISFNTDVANKLATDFFLHVVIVCKQRQVFKTLSCIQRSYHVEKLKVLQV